MSAARSDRKTRWTVRAALVLVRLLGSTWRVRYRNDLHVLDARRKRQPVAHVFWHGQLLPLLWAHRGRGVSVLISEHRDGEIIARIAEGFGYRTVRGSTTRGASRALVGLTREIEAGVDVAVTPDGPRGPAHSFAPGVLLVAQRTRCPLLPTAAAVSRAWHLNSWDRFVVPKPFARITVAYGDFLYVRDGSRRALDTQLSRAALEAAMSAAEA